MKVEHVNGEPLLVLRLPSEKGVDPVQDGLAAHPAAADRPLDGRRDLDAGLAVALDGRYGLGIGPQDLAAQLLVGVDGGVEIEGGLIFIE